MIPLADLIAGTGPDYHRYLTRKTGFLVTADTSSRLAWFWSHIIRDFDSRQLLEELPAGESQALRTILAEFGDITAEKSEAHHDALERRLPWVFRHPLGGYFIPTELFKNLMQSRRLASEGFLFALLYRLKFRELKDLAAFLAAGSPGFPVPGTEEHPLDMALSIYMWYSRPRNTATMDFLRESEKEIFVRVQSSEIPMWSVLKGSWPMESENIRQWQMHLLDGRKGFFRSLNLLGPSSIPGIFRSGVWIPLLPTRIAMDSIESIKVITPVEIRQRLRGGQIAGS